MAISDEFCNNSALGFQDNPKSINCTGNIGNPNVQIFLNTKRSKTKVPANKNLELLFKINKLYEKINRGNQIMVGLMAKTNIERANKNPVFLLDEKTSFKIINESTIAGKSDEGDWVNK